MLSIGLPPPFTVEWLPTWIFVGFGGLITAFIAIGDIDKRLFFPFIAKPLIGIATGMAVALMINGQTTPPSTTLPFWGFFGSVCSTPILTGLLVFISDQKRQNELYQSAQDKFLPWSKNKENKDGRV